MVLKRLLGLSRWSILIPFVRLCSFWVAQAQTYFTTHPRGGKSGKNPQSRHAWGFLSRPSRRRSYLPKNRRDPGTLLTTKNTHTPRKIKILQITPYYQLVGFYLNYAVLPSVRSIQVVGDSCTTCRRTRHRVIDDSLHTISNLWTTWL